MNCDPSGLDTRPLTADEVAAYDRLVTYLSSHTKSPEWSDKGSKTLHGLLHKAGVIRVDTSMQAEAQWRWGTLYLNPSIVSDLGTEYARNPRNRAIVFALLHSKLAWNTSVLYHEFGHFIKGESYFNPPWQIASDERRCWGYQIGWLTDLLATYKDSPKTRELIMDKISDAKERRSGF